MNKQHTSEEIKYRLSDLGAQIGSIAIEYISNLEKQIEKMKADVKELAEQADKNGDMLALKRMSELFEKWEQEEL